MANIKRITIRDRIRTVADRWEERYGHKPVDYLCTGGISPRAVLAKLRMLDLETATVEDVAGIIGNDTWTKVYCNACEQWDIRAVTRSAGIHAGDDYHICDDCLAEICLVAGREVEEA